MWRKDFRNYLAVLTLGLLAGSLVGEVLARYLPEGVAKSFFTNSVTGQFGPVSVDLIAIALTLGPLSIAVNLMTIVGVVLAAYLFRSFF
ncbi:MAG: DUF4321 domain-containing protein [Gemmatimonadota bacterium]